MTDFKGIRGWKVQTLSTDPIASAVDGGSWSSANSSNTNHSNGGGAGIQTSAMAYGGDTPSPGVEVEEYNGTSWTEIAELNIKGSRHGSGANAEAVIATGGSGPSNCLLYTSDAADE